LLIALGVRERLWWAGMSAPLTMGLVLVTGVIAGVSGLTIYSFAVITALAVVLAFCGQWLKRRRIAPALVESAGETAAEPTVEKNQAAPGTLTGKAYPSHGSPVL
jgi:hypothetical protein